MRDILTARGRIWIALAIVLAFILAWWGMNQYPMTSPPVAVRSSEWNGNEVVVVIYQGVESPEAMRALAQAITLYPSAWKYHIRASNQAEELSYSPSDGSLSNEGLIPGHTWTPSTWSKSNQPLQPYEVYEFVSKRTIFRIANNGGIYSDAGSGRSTCPSPCET